MLINFSNEKTRCDRVHRHALLYLLSIMLKFIVFFYLLNEPSCPASSHYRVYQCFAFRRWWSTTMQESALLFGVNSAPNAVHGVVSEILLQWAAAVFSLPCSLLNSAMLRFHSFNAAVESLPCNHFISVMQRFEFLNVAVKLLQCGLY